MFTTAGNRWWSFLVQGVVMIAIAILVLVQPSTLIMLIGAYAVIDGIIKLIATMSGEEDGQSRILALVIAAVSIVTGIIILTSPVFAAGLLTLIIAIWAVVVGAMLLIWAFRLRKDAQNEWLMIVFGGVSILFGLLVFANIGQQDGVLALRTLFFVYMLVGGVLAIALALRIRSLRDVLAVGTH
jgi:uncharacterized membrane protein HdeD (DUF308 family)